MVIFRNEPKGPLARDARHPWHGPLPMTTVKINPAGVLASLMVLAVALGCVRLGFWQLDRLEQRRERNREVAVRMAAPPLHVSAPIADPDAAYRRARARGRFDHARTVILGGRSHRGAPGVHILTPLLVEERPGAAIIVNRGWVPSPDAASVDLTALPAPESATVDGVLLPLSNADAAAAAYIEEDGRDQSRLVFRPDAERLRGLLPYDFGVVYLQALPRADRSAEEYPLPLPEPEASEGNHLGYALQWFSFAAIAVIGWLVLVARRGEDGAGRGRTGGSPETPTQTASDGQTR